MRKAKRYVVLLGLMVLVITLGSCSGKEEEASEEPGEEEEVAPEESPTGTSGDTTTGTSGDSTTSIENDSTTGDSSSSTDSTTGGDTTTASDSTTGGTTTDTAGSTTTTDSSSSDTTTGSTTSGTTGDTTSGSTTSSTTTSTTTGGTTSGETTTTTSTTGSTSGTSEETSCTPSNLFSGSSSEIGSSLPTAYEPSGAVWHSRLESYFVVSDTGKVSRLNADGTVVQTWSVSGDLEGITVADPDTNFIYVGVERSPLSIKEFNISTGSLTRTFDLSTWMSPSTANQGLEALTFVSDTTSSEGGYFYAGLQENGRIYVFELPIQSSSTSTTVTYIQTITPDVGYTDVSGLEYHEPSNTLYALYDGANTVVSMSLDGTTSQTWSAPHDDQEGLAFDNQCNILLTLDTEVDNGEVWFFDE